MNPQITILKIVLQNIVIDGFYRIRVTYFVSIDIPRRMPNYKKTVANFRFTQKVCNTVGNNKITDFARSHLKKLIFENTHLNYWA